MNVAGVAEHPYMSGQPESFRGWEPSGQGVTGQFPPS